MPRGGWEASSLTGSSKSNILGLTGGVVANKCLTIHTFGAPTANQCRQRLVPPRTSVPSSAVRRPSVKHGAAFKAAVALTPGDDSCGNTPIAGRATESKDLALSVSAAFLPSLYGPG